jgi:oxygen-independent coproporphyrinogen III oxidase
MKVSLYVHIPFCVKKCRYCDFYSVPYDQTRARDYGDALVQEWEGVCARFEDEPLSIDTVYIGGGTPSVLSPPQLQRLCSSISSMADCSECREWTVECNPESFTEEKAQILVSAGVTRLTFGVQSTGDTDLRLLGRAHDSHRVNQVLASAPLGLFRSVGVDLMYGLPWQSPETVQQSAVMVTGFSSVKHVSAYELSINPGTPFGRHRSKLRLPDEDTSCEMAKIITDVFTVSGFERYEIANFALQGHRSIHNQAYWNHLPYIGLGCAAHSYVHPVRWANIRDIDRYIDAVHEQRPPLEYRETIDVVKLAEELIFLGLRQCDGLDEQRYESMTGMSFMTGSRSRKLGQYLDSGLIVKRGTCWKLTFDGMLLADALARELME